MSAPNGATWRSGYATVCKTVYTSSILVVASIFTISKLARDLEAFSEAEKCLMDTRRTPRPPLRQARRGRPELVDNPFHLPRF